MRDAVAAYALLIEHGRPATIYNVCSGGSLSLGELLDTLLQIAGVQANIVSDTSQTRPGDLADVYGSYARLEAATGWRPNTPLVKSLTDMLEAARAG